MKQTDNQRKFPRVIRAFFTAAKWYEANGEPWLADVGNTVDISEGGVLMEGCNAPPFMAKLKLSVAVGDQIIKLEGEVTRLIKIEDGKIQMGIEFINLTDSQRRMISAALGPE